MKNNRIREYAKLFRFHGFGAAITAVVGAMSVEGEALELSHFIILFMAGVLFSINCAVLNDYMDVDIDRRSKYLSDRPLVKGTISKKNALIISLLVLIIGVGALLHHLITTQRYLSIIICVICGILGVSYNFVGKKFVWGTVFVPASMGFFLLFGATVFSDKIQSITDIPILTWILFILTFNQLFFMNTISGGLKDVENDRESGATTLAVSLGVKTSEKMNIPMSFKAIGISVRSASAILVFIPFLLLDFPFWHIQMIILVALTISMLYWMMKMLNMRSFDRKEMIRYIRLQLLARYFLVPVMLMYFIGITWTILLIILPFISYALGTVIYGRPLRAPKSL